MKARLVQPWSIVRLADGRVGIKMGDVPRGRKPIVRVSRELGVEVSPDAEVEVVITPGLLAWAYLDRLPKEREMATTVPEFMQLIEQAVDDLVRQCLPADSVPSFLTLPLREKLEGLATMAALANRLPKWTEALLQMQALLPATAAGAEEACQFLDPTATPPYCRRYEMNALCSTCPLRPGPTASVES